MPQEPWKRASQLQRAVPREAREAPAPPPLQPKRSGWGFLLLLIPLILVVMWFYYDSIQAEWFHLTGHEPRLHASLKPASLQLPIGKPKAVVVNADTLDEGLGIGLRVYDDYHTLLDKTKDRGLEWKFAAAAKTLRMSAPGVTVYVENDLITAYTLKLGAIYAEPNWKWWQGDLKQAGLTENAKQEDVTGQATGGDRVSLYGSRTITMPSGWANPAYELDFEHGVLTEVHAGIRPCAGKQSQP
jgi:hypothetical protein